MSQIRSWEATRPAFLSVPPGGVLVATDYDGTIAPIVSDPEQALPLPALIVHLSALVPLVRGVAVISGRSETSLRRLLPVPGVIRIGENGIGTLSSDERSLLRDFELRAGAVVDRWAGVVIESKPASVSIHYRSRPEVALELKSALSGLIAGSGLTLVANRMVFDVQLRRSGKIRTMCGLLRDLKPAAVLYAGDSRDDSRVHRCLQGAAIPRLCVGLASDDLPGGIFKQADLILDGPYGMEELFSRLVQLWSPSPSERD